MTPSRPFKLLVSALVLSVLIAAEAMAVRHSLDFDSHANDEPCKICVTVAGLGAVAPAKAVAAVSTSAVEPEAARRDVVRAFDRFDRPSARAPPLVS